MYNRRRNGGGHNGGFGYENRKPRTGNRGYGGPRGQRGHGGQGRKEFGGGKTLFGTEQDPHNCSFFLRIGACRHGENCPKKHNWPSFSNTLLFEHIWVASKTTMSNKRKLQKHYDEFLEDFMEELLKYGDVLETQTIMNTGDHMIGNTFVKYADEEQAANCLKAVNGRFYAGRKVICKYSPITDFENARCRDYMQQECKRGKFCNFAHFMDMPKWVEEHFTNLSAFERYQKREKVQRERDYDKQTDSWPKFPIDGSEADRKATIKKWNTLRNPDAEVNIKTEISNSKSNIDIPKSKGGLNLFLPGQREEPHA